MKSAVLHIQALVLTLWPWASYLPSLRVSFFPPPVKWEWEAWIIRVVLILPARDAESGSL